MLNSTKYILLFTLFIPVAQADDILDVQSRIRRGELQDNPSTVGGFALPRTTLPKKPKKQIKPKVSKPKIKPSTSIPFTEKKEKKSPKSVPKPPKPDKPTEDKKTTSEKFKEALEERKGKDKWSLGSGSTAANSEAAEYNSAQMIKRKAEIERILEADSKTSFGSISISKKARLKKELKEINRLLSKSAPVDEDDILRHTESVIDKVRKAGGLR